MAILGEASLGGEKSLLFRWHYALGAFRIFASDPYLGVGPDGFQSAFLSMKNAFNPEEPVSAHNVVLDWFSTLGPQGREPVEDDVVRTHGFLRIECVLHGKEC